MSDDLKVVFVMFSVLWATIVLLGFGLHIDLQKILARLSGTEKGTK